MLEIEALPRLMNTAGGVVIVADNTWAAIQGRKTKVRNWLLDFNLLMSYWGGEGGRTYHHTAPINALYGLHEALVVLFEEGQQAAIVRHARMHEALVAGLEAMGLSLLTDRAHRLPQLNPVVVPDGSPTPPWDRRTFVPTVRPVTAPRMSC